MTKQIVLVRKLPPSQGLDYRMYARNLSTGDVKVIDYPWDAKDDPFGVALGALMPGVWYNPQWSWGPDGAREYDVEV